MPHRNLHRILYIEDDAALARLLQKRMERQNYTIEIAPDAETGITMMQQQPYDLVLIDYNLPGMSGLEFLEHLTAMPTPVPAIILTAGGDERVALEALEKGASDYAVKDAGQTYLDLLPTVMQAAYAREMLMRENERQRQELILAKEIAEAANEAKSNFLATMSHEIRTPLNVVTGLARLLINTPLNPDQQKMIETLQTNADLLLKLINDLLDISRIESGQVTLESIDFDLGSVLNDIQVMFESGAKQKNITLRTDDQTGALHLLGDRTRVQQILMNLVSNAVKFTDGGVIDIRAIAERTSDDQCDLVLTVSDTGIGIPRDKLGMIFSKFTQADASITRRFGGSGLGLTIAHSLAVMMGGGIDAAQNLPHGSVFTVRLRLPVSHEANIFALPEETAVPMTGGHVLLVEDYAPNVMVASMMLEELGIAVTVAESGTQAIARMQEATQPFLAILMDVQMHGMDGLETTRRIRTLEAEKGQRTTIIGVTAHALAGDRDRCLAAGMDDYISKPINPDILASKLGHLSSIAAA